MSELYKTRFGRKYETRKPHKKMYIFTEGEETEPNYFKSKKDEIEEEIRKRQIEIIISGTGHNTLSLVNLALEFAQNKKIELDGLPDSDEVWVVFDKDSFNKFDDAINKASANNLKVAYSNVSFELWYLLHFNYYNSAIGREVYIEKLTQELRKLTGDKKIEYSKVSKDMYSLVKDREMFAIKYAKKLITLHSGEKVFSKKDPSTTVFLLVEAINKLKT